MKLKQLPSYFQWYPFIENDQKLNFYSGLTHFSPLKLFDLNFILKFL